MTRLTASAITDDQLDALHEQLMEARMWARHGYEIGQRHCGWADHGVAPGWLTEGWPTSFDSCEHLAGLAEAETRIAAVRALHTTELGNEFGGLECSTCREIAPCPTIRALDGQETTR